MLTFLILKLLYSTIYVRKYLCLILHVILLNRPGTHETSVYEVLWACRLICGSIALSNEALQLKNVVRLSYILHLFRSRRRARAAHKTYDTCTVPAI